MGEATEGSDVLLGDIGVGGGVVLGASSLALSDSVDLLVELSPVEVSGLTSSGHTPGHSGGMPGSDTSDLPVTSVGLLLQMSHTPSLDDTGESLTLGNSDHVQDLVLSEDIVDPDLLLEVGVGEVDLLADGLATVDLDFEDVVLLLSQVLQQVVLGVHDGSHTGAVLLDSVQLHFHSLGVLGGFGLVVAEGFSLGANPVLVEPSKRALVEVVGPNGGEGSESTGGLNVADETDDLKRRGLNDGDGFNLLLLVELGLGSVDISEDVGHAGLESSEGGEVGSLALVVSGE